MIKCTDWLNEIQYRQCAQSRQQINKLKPEMTETKRIIPQLSANNQKNEAKKLDSQVQTMKNRVELLRMQLQRQKDNIKKHKQLTKQVIQKKVQVGKINQWKVKENSEEIEKIQQLRRKNHDLRASHQKELQDIQKAIYLVKLDDARQVKNISMQHNRKIKEMQSHFMEQQQKKKQKIVEETQAAKERYVRYWKDKLTNIYTEQAQTIIETSKRKEENQKELQRLEQEELKLMQQINLHHSKGVEFKKEYLAAMSIPVKEVAQAVGGSIDNASSLSRRKSMTLNNSQLSTLENKSPRYVEAASSRVPNAQVNQDKLKIVLQQLKKIDRSAVKTSR